jgi:hypothetical protein
MRSHFGTAAILALGLVAISSRAQADTITENLYVYNTSTHQVTSTRAGTVTITDTCGGVQCTQITYGADAKSHPALDISVNMFASYSLYSNSTYFYANINNASTDYATIVNPAAGPLPSGSFVVNETFPGVTNDTFAHAWGVRGSFPASHYSAFEFLTGTAYSSGPYLTTLSQLVNSAAGFDFTGDLYGGTVVVASLPVPAPIVGAGLPGLVAACGGLIALARRRRKMAT